MALVLFGLGLVTFFVGAVRFYAANPNANAKEDQAVTVTPEPQASPAVPSPLTPTIPVPDDRAQLGPTVQAELQKRLNAARQSEATSETLGRLGVFYEAHSYLAFALQCYELAKGKACLQADADPQCIRWKYYWSILAYNIADQGAAVNAMRFVTQQDPSYGPAQERLGLMLLDSHSELTGSQSRLAGSRADLLDSRASLLDSGVYDEASRAFERVAELHPRAASGYVGLGRVLLALNKPKEAAERFRQALEKDMQNGQAHYLLGQTYQRLGQTRAARRELARGIRSDSARLPDRWHSDITAALVGPKARLAYSRFIMTVDRIDEAIELLSTLLLINPADVDVANTLALAHLKNGQPEQALPVLHAAADTGRRSYLTFAHLARTLLEMRELDAALDHAEQAIEIAPMTARGYFIKGRVLYAMTRDREAVAALRKALELDPRHPEAYFRLGLASARLGRHVDAIESLETAAEFSPNSVIPLYNLGMIHARAGRFDLASDALNRALKIDPFDAKVRTALDRVEKGLRRQ